MPVNTDVNNYYGFVVFQSLINEVISYLSPFILFEKFSLMACVQKYTVVT